MMMEMLIADAHDDDDGNEDDSEDDDDYVECTVRIVHR